MIKKLPKIMIFFFFIYIYKLFCVPLLIGHKRYLTLWAAMNNSKNKFVDRLPYKGRAALDKY